ncbi:MAG: trimethylamine methyltransferase family protein [Acidobacteria bacterium]|nr:trimethylamine methyltransferase family protein [Acidobacteriota bacterium]
MPISGEAGGAMTWRPDVQNGAEGMAYLLASHLGGQNLIGGIGSMDNANGMSGEQIIMQCGLIDMAEYIARGAEISEHAPACESIRNVGPGGSFMTEELTIERMRSDEFFDSRHFDLSGAYEPYAPGICEKAHREADPLVAAFRSRVPERVVEAVKSYFRGKYRDAAVAQRPGRAAP